MKYYIKAGIILGIFTVVIGYGFGYFTNGGHGPNNGLGGYVILFIAWLLGTCFTGALLLISHENE